MPRPLQNVIASYVRDGLSQKDAEQAAKEWQKRMEEQRAELTRTILKSGASRDEVDNYETDHRF